MPIPHSLLEHRNNLGYIDKAAIFKALDYTPHRGQWEIHNSLAPRRIVSCGVRWG